MIHSQLRQSATVKSIADKAAAIVRRWFHVVHALRYCGRKAIAAAGSVIDASRLLRGTFKNMVAAKQPSK